MTSVLHVGLESPETRMGGLNRYLAELATAERELGWDVSVCWIADAPVTNAVAVRPGLSWPWRLWRFARVMRSSRAEVIDVHFPAHAVLALATGAIRGRPLVVHFQGPWALESRSAGGGRVASVLKTCLEGYVLRRADLVVVLSAAVRRVAVERYRVAPHRVAVEPPGVRPAPVLDRAALRGDLGLAQDDVLWLAVRRLFPRMGLDVALGAFASGSAPNERFVIVGDGPERATLAALAADLGVAASVTFTGHVDDETLAQWYAAADVSLVPSSAHEGFGLVVLESLAHGTPVVTSDVDGLRDAARVSGAVSVRARTPGALRAGVADLLATPGVRHLARSSVEVMGWPAVAARHLAHYDALLAGERPHSVIWLDHTAVLGGGELALARTASALSARWRPHVIVATPGPLVSELEDRGVSVEVLAMPERTRTLSRDAAGHAGGVGPLVDTLVYAARLRWRLHLRRPDVVHTNSMKAHYYGTLASLFAPWRSVMHVRDRWRPPYVSVGVARDLRLLARFGPDAIVANSADTAAAVGSAVSVVASPIEEEFFRVPAPVPGPTLTVAAIGRLAPWKGQDLAIAAVTALRATLDVRLVVVGAALFGEDDFATSLTAQVAALGAGDYVTFTGAVRDVAAVLAAVDVVVLTSRSPEPFGNVVVEAMAAGRAVVVPNRGGVTEYVIDAPTTGTGYFYEMGNVDDLVAVLARVSADSNDRVRRGARARATARAFAAPSVAAALEAIYDHVG